MDPHSLFQGIERAKWEPVDYALSCLSQRTGMKMVVKGKVLHLCIVVNAFPLMASVGAFEVESDGSRLCIRCALAMYRGSGPRSPNSINEERR